MTYEEACVKANDLTLRSLNKLDQYVYIANEVLDSKDAYVTKHLVDDCRLEFVCIEIDCIDPINRLWIQEFKNE